MSLGIKALPTFHLYKNSKLVDSMTGAKVREAQGDNATFAMVGCVVGLSRLV